MSKFLQNTKEKVYIFLKSCFADDKFSILFFMGISLLLTWMPIENGARYLNTQTAGQVICGSLIFILLRNKNQNIYKYPLWSISLFWIGILIISCIFSITKLASIEEFMRYIMYISIAIAIFSWSDSKDRMKLVSYTLLSSGLIISCFAIFEFFNEYFNTLSFNLASAPFGRTNDLGAYMLLIFPLALSNFLYENDEYAEKAFYALVSIFTVITIVLTFSRGIWLSSIIAVILILLLGIKILKKNIIYLGIVAVISLIPVVINWEAIVIRFLSIQNIFNSAENSIEWRKSLIKSTFEIFMDNPAIGTGINSFSFIVSAYQKRAGYFSVNPHNYYLQLLAETGVIGLFTFIILALSILYMSFKAYKNSEKIYRGIALGLLVSIISSLVHISVDIDWSVLSIPMVFWMEVGLLIAIYHSVNFKETRFTQFNNRFDYLKKFIFIIFAVSLIVIPTMNYISFQSYVSANYQRVNNDLEKAKVLTQRAMLFAPYSSAKHNNLYAQILYKEKKYDEALNYVGKSIKLDPYNYRYYKNYAKILIKQDSKNNLDEALENLKKSVTYNPFTHPEIYGDVADFYIQKLKNVDEAIKWYKLAIEKFPVSQITSYERYTPDDRFELYSIYKNLSFLSELKKVGSGKEYKKISDFLLTSQPKIQSPYDNINSTPTDTIKNYWKKYGKEDISFLTKSGEDIFTLPPDFKTEFIDFIKIEHFIFSVKLEYMISAQDKNTKRNFIVVDEVIPTDNGWIISSRSKKEDNEL